MRPIQFLFSSELIEALGWTIVHSLWQGALVAILLFVLLLILQRYSAQLKYIISFAALVIMLSWSTATFVRSYNYASHKAVLRENIISTPGYMHSLLEKSKIERNANMVTEREVLNLRMLKIRSFLQRNFQFVCGLWLIGLLFLSARLILGFIYLRRIRTSNLVRLSDDLVEKIVLFSEKLNLKRKINAFFSPLIFIPTTVGSLKPILLFPISAFTGLSSNEIEAIIAHELAHVLRHDYFFNIIQTIVEMLFFFNPAIWMISEQIRNERENSCDNIAIQLTGDKISFVKALAAVQIQQIESERLSMAFVSSKRNVLQRIKRLNKKVTMKTNFTEGLIAATVIVIGLTLASFTFKNESEDRSDVQNSKIAVDSTASKATINNNTLAVDSLLKAIKHKTDNNEIVADKTNELNEAIETALSTTDEEVSAQILIDINAALDDIDIAKIVEEAMKEASKAIKEAHAEIDHEEINRDLKEASKDIEEARKEVERDMLRDIKNASEVEREAIVQGYKAAQFGLNIAASVIENLNIEGIIDASLNGVEASLNLSSKSNCDTSCKQHVATQKELQHKKELLKQREKQLKKQQQQLQKEKEKLEKQIDSLDNE